jgi:Ca2+-binding RTX toxin-like protein
MTVSISYSRDAVAIDMRDFASFNEERVFSLFPAYYPDADGPLDSRRIFLYNKPAPYQYGSAARVDLEGSFSRDETGALDPLGPVSWLTVKDAGDINWDNANHGNQPWSYYRVRLHFTESPTIAEVSAALVAHDFAALLAGQALHVQGSGYADVLIGTAFDDVFHGGSGADTLRGGVGDDSLGGGPGQDKLLGGAGADHFTFRASPATTGVDRINDFNSAEGDRIVLDNDFFSVGTAGASLGARFFSATDITTNRLVPADARILYDQDSGDLYYDPTGGDGADRVRFAKIYDPAHHPLSAGDFVIAE